MNAPGPRRAKGKRLPQGHCRQPRTLWALAEDELTGKSHKACGGNDCYEDPQWAEITLWELRKNQESKGIKKKTETT